MRAGGWTARALARAIDRRADARATRARRRARRIPLERKAHDVSVGGDASERGRARGEGRMRASRFSSQRPNGSLDDERARRSGREAPASDDGRSEDTRAGYHATPARVRAARDRLEAVTRELADDLARASDGLLREIDAERERALDEIDEVRRDVLRAKDLLDRERRDFDARRAMQEDELAKAFAELREERATLERERSAFERARVAAEAEARVHERYARASGSIVSGSVIARSVSYAASQSLGGDVGNEEDLRAFERVDVGSRGVARANSKVDAWVNEAVRETPALKTPSTSKWRLAKDRVTTISRAIENATLTKTADAKAAAGIAPESARASVLDGIELFGRVLCIGGLERGSDSPLSEVEYMKPGDADANGFLRWKPFASLNTPRAYAACSTTAIGGAVVIGGSDGQEALRSVEEYRESVGKWRTVDPMSVPRIWCGSTMIDGVTYACGGYDGEYYLHSMEANKTFGSFDFGDSSADDRGVGSQPSSSWVTCAPMSEGRATLGVGTLSGKLFAVGGFSGAGEILDLCEVYDPRADAWVTGQPLKHKRRDLGMASLSARGFLIAVGGRDERSVLNIVEAFDPRDSARGWRALSPMHYRRQLHATVVDPSGDAVYAIGGFDGVSAISAVELYDVRADKWREVAPCKTARLGVVACCVP